MVETRLLEGYVVTHSWLADRLDIWLGETIEAWVRIRVFELDEHGYVEGMIGSTAHVRGDLYSDDEGSDAGAGERVAPWRNSSVPVVCPRRHELKFGPLSWAPPWLRANFVGAAW